MFPPKDVHEIDRTHLLTFSNFQMTNNQIVDEEVKTQSNEAPSNTEPNNELPPNTNNELPPTSNNGLAPTSNNELPPNNELQPKNEINNDLPQEGHPSVGHRDVVQNSESLVNIGNGLDQPSSKPVPVPKYRPGKWRIGTLLPAPAGSVPDDFEPYDHRADIVKGATT